MTWQRFLVFAAAAGGVAAADQATKAWVVGTFRLYEIRPVVEGLFNLTYIRNPGAAFGLFATWSEGFRQPFFLGVTAVALVALGVMAQRLPRGKPWSLAALALVAGGAVGNLVDRLVRGEVVDFLDVYWRSNHWPSFNTADSAITVGVAILLFQELFGGRRADPPPGVFR
jgi:signal peptidase II